MSNDSITRGEGRRVVSTKLYRSEFANIMKICEAENKSIHQKLRELVQQEIVGNPLTKQKKGIESEYERVNIKQKQWNFEVKE
ncbi:MAG: hypothetical protein AABX23_04575 [Nanoarchaeota archaeon]